MKDSLIYNKIKQDTREELKTHNHFNLKLMFVCLFVCLIVYLFFSYI